jgi:alanine racemase
MRRARALLSPQTRFCAVVKADAYGHGVLPVSRIALEEGADYLAVAILREGCCLREAGFTVPILILGCTPPEEAIRVVGHGLTQTVYAVEQAEALSRAALALGMRAKVHVKVDTGMSRLGVAPEEAGEFCRFLAALPGLELEGLFTHFAAADSEDKSKTQEQFAAFKVARESARACGLHIPIQHCANSAATLDCPETHLDMARLGIILYGLSPTGNKALDREGRWPIQLTPAMRLKARLAMVKTLPAGASVSYGATFTARREMLLGTLPIGYADGYSRMLSGKAGVLCAHKKVPLVGRICMDQCMADLSGTPEAKAGDEVTLFGPPELPADELAALLGTINYEIVCMVGRRVPRIYL